MLQYIMDAHNVSAYEDGDVVGVDMRQVHVLKIAPFTLCDWPFNLLGVDVELGN